MTAASPCRPAATSLSLSLSINIACLHLTLAPFNESSRLSSRGLTPPTSSAPVTSLCLCSSGENLRSPEERSLEFKDEKKNTQKTQHQIKLKYKQITDVSRFGFQIQDASMETLAELAKYECAVFDYWLDDQSLKVFSHKRLSNQISHHHYKLINQSRSTCLFLFCASSTRQNISLMTNIPILLLPLQWHPLLYIPEWITVHHLLPWQQSEAASLY